VETRMRGFGAEVDRAICPSTVTNSGRFREPADKHSIYTLTFGQIFEKKGTAMLDNFKAKASFDQVGTDIAILTSSGRVIGSGSTGLRNMFYTHEPMKMFGSGSNKERKTQCKHLKMTTSRPMAT